MEMLAFHYTDRCNIECAHCCVSSGPGRETKIDPDLAARLIRQAAALGVRAVKFTGGEALLYPDEITRLTALAAGLGLRVGVVTNGHWAPTLAEGRAFLEPLVAAGLDEIDISIDRWHWEFLDPAKVGHAIAAARGCSPLTLRLYRTLKATEAPDDAAFYAAYGLADGEIQLESCNANDLIRRGDAEAPGRVLVRWTYASRIGRGKSLPLADTRAVPVDLTTPIPCTEVAQAPIVYPDGMLYACCSGKVPRPLHVGSVHDADLPELQARMDRDPLLQLIATLSPRRLHDALRARGVDLPAACDSVCHLCKSALSSADGEALRRAAAEELNLHIVESVLGLGVDHG